MTDNNQSCSWLALEILLTASAILAHIKWLCLENTPYRDRFPTLAQGGFYIIMRESSKASQ